MVYRSNATEKLYDRGLAEGKAEREALLAENAKLRALLNDLLNEHEEMNRILRTQGRGANTNEMSPAGEARAALAGQVSK